MKILVQENIRSFILCVFRWGTNLYVTSSIHVWIRLSVHPLQTITQEPSVYCNHNFQYTYVKWWYLMPFFIFFFSIWVFWAVKGVKGKKIAQNEKCKLHPSHAISEEQYSIWSWFLVHFCKMIISPDIFVIFQNVDFSGF